MNNRGFTLIELLVAISIVAVMSALSFVAYSTVQRSARDNQRLIELRNRQAILQVYYADKSSFPASIGSSPQDLTNCTGISGCSTPTKKYGTFNTDPLPGWTDYCYISKTNSSVTSNCTSGESCQYFEIYTKLEDITKAMFTPPIAVSGCGGNVYNYKVTSQ